MQNYLLMCLKRETVNWLLKCSEQIWLIQKLNDIIIHFFWVIAKSNVRNSIRLSAPRFLNVAEKNFHLLTLKLEILMHNVYIVLCGRTDGQFH